MKVTGLAAHYELTWLLLLDMVSHLDLWSQPANVRQNNNTTLSSTTNALTKLTRLKMLARANWQDNDDSK